MQSVLVQMAGLIACGVLWRLISPAGLDPETARRVLTGLVYNILLPALVLLVLWRAPLGADTARIAIAGAAGVLAGLGAAWLAYRMLSVPRAVAGAMILAAGFPNVTYLGLPVLENTFGPWARGIAIQYDLFACTPLLLTVGIALARAHRACAPDENEGNPFLALLKVPPLWAALAAVILNLMGTPLPPALGQWLQTLANGVVPLMLIALGMALTFDTQQFRRTPLVFPALAIQLLLMPLLVWGLAHTLGLTGEKLAAVVLEAAMPSMVLGLVLCDRYGLDTTLYAAAVTLSTALSLVTLPLWYDWVM